MSTMKKVLVGAAIALASMAAPALADPSCTGEDLYCAQAPTVGIPGSKFVFFSGLVEVGPKSQGTSPGFYFVIDGNSTDIDPMDGYIGFSSADLLKSNSILGLIGSRTGDFDRGGQNNAAFLGFIDLSGPPTVVGFAPALDLLGALGLK